jgi:hypothetical protein
VNPSTRKEALVVVAVGLAIWGVFLFFQNSYFGSFFFDVPTPFWAAWVGQVPLWAFNVIDTFAVALIVVGLIIELSGRSKRRSIRASHRGSAVTGALVALVVLVVLGALLFILFHITFSDFVNGARGFFLPGH